MTNRPTSVHSGSDTRMPGASFGNAVPAPRITAPAPAPDIRAQWRQLGAFLVRPVLPELQVENEAMLILARIFALDVLAMLLLVVVAAIAVATGVYVPETALAGIEFTPIVLLMVLVGAPVFEELVFRGWLSGKPGAVFALLLILGGAAGFWFVHRINLTLSFGLVIAGVVGALLCLVLLRKRGTMPWFASLFPLFFWTSAAGFALVHILNFDMSGSLASQLILLPLVLPQFILGMLCGYVRVQIGLWAAILLHFAHNAFALSLAGLSMLAGA